MFRFTIRDVLWLTVVVALAATGVVALEAMAQERSSLDATKSAVEKLTDGDIEWDSLGFHGGPRLTGANAIAVWQRDVSQTPELLKRLNDDKSFIAAHVLLTSLWRVPQRNKNSFSHPLTDGFFVCHNGLNVRITWEAAAEGEKKQIVFPDLDCQRKRVREFWSTRVREHPEEFSTDTKLDEDKK
jgi:hypothetical protein